MPEFEPSRCRGVGSKLMVSLLAWLALFNTVSVVCTAGHQGRDFCVEVMSLGDQWLFLVTNVDYDWATRIGDLKSWNIINIFYDTKKNT